MPNVCTNELNTLRRTGSWKGECLRPCTVDIHMLSPLATTRSRSSESLVSSVNRCLFEVKMLLGTTAVPRVALTVAALSPCVEEEVGESAVKCAARLLLISF